LYADSEKRKSDANHNAAPRSSISCPLYPSPTLVRDVTKVFDEGNIPAALQ
jgi:hypothetical protein